MEVIYYKTQDGKEPIKEWFSSLRDKVFLGRIKKRLQRLRLGNLGDYDTVGDGVIELREHYGAGYRIYCGKKGDQLIILLCGGDKSSQQKDIRKAKEYWNDYNSN